MDECVEGVIHGVGKGWRQVYHRGLWRVRSADELRGKVGPRQRFEGESVVLRWKPQSADGRAQRVFLAVKTTVGPPRIRATTCLDSTAKEHMDKSHFTILHHGPEETGRIVLVQRYPALLC